MVEKYIPLEDVEEVYLVNDWDPHDKHICLADLRCWKPLTNMPHWIMTRTSDGSYRLRCSECKMLAREPTEYCPGCGKHMVGLNEYIKL